MKRAKANTRPFWRFVFLCYCVMMLWLLFFGNRGAAYDNYWEQVQHNYSLRPFYTIRNYLQVIHRGTSGYWVRHCTINLLGNILLFVPGGFLLPRVFPKFRAFWRSLLLFFGVLIIIEVLQLFTLLGRLDVDDMLLNLFGLCVGYGIYKLTK